MSTEPSHPATQTMSHMLVAVLAVLAVLAWQAWSGRDAAHADAPQPIAEATAAALPGAVTADRATADPAKTASAPAELHTDKDTPPPAAESGRAAEIAAESAADRVRARAPVQISMSPMALRVWHNTRVQLRAEPGPEAQFERYVWHFEDGSDPVEGVAVEHVFPESVTDRHITLEAHRSGGTPLVISKRLPIERLRVVAVDSGDDVIRPVPKVRGLRLALLGVGAVAPPAAVIRRLLQLHVAAFIVFGSAPAAGAAAQILTELQSAVPLLHVDTTLASVEVPLPDAALDRAALTVIFDPLHRVTAVPGVAVWQLNHVAFVVHDSRPLASSEAAMLGLQRALEVASAYSAVALLSARPLSPLVDADQVADRAFRIYEHALRREVRVAISASSGVAYDGRYGGLTTTAVGQVTPLGCARLAGSDHCQAGTVTLLDIRSKGTPRSLHLRRPSLTAWLDDAVLPPAVGKYRR